MANQYNQYSNQNSFTAKYATAPYNFIPYDPSRIVSALDDSDRPLFSGTIECSLEAKSPLLVGSAEKEVNEDGSTIRQFFKVDGEPVIPGTSIKGMIRNFIQIISHSWMNPVTDNKIFFRDVASGNDSEYKQKFPNPEKNQPILGGYLEKFGSRYKLYPTNVRAVPIGTIGAYKTGQMKDKKHDYMFDKLSPSTNAIELDSDVVSDFRLQMTDGQKKIWKEEENALNNGKKARIFYIQTEEGKVCALGIARYFRVGYNKTPYDLTGNDPANDFTEQMFGSIRNNVATKGKLSFSAAKFTKYSYMKNPLFAILSEPHPSCVRHYLKQHDIGPKKYEPRDLATYNQKSDSLLRGYKYYWHRQWPKNQAELDEDMHSNGNKKVMSELHPLEVGAQAKFTITVNKLNETELGALIESLDLKEGLAHKLGTGKTIGLGSVRINVDEIKVQTVTKKYASLSDRFYNGEGTYITKDDIDSARNSFKTHVENTDKRKWGEMDSTILLLLPYGMSDFNHKPDNASTQNMPLSDGDPCFSKSKAILKKANRIVQKPKETKPKKKK